MTNTDPAAKRTDAAQLCDQDLENVVGGRFIKLTSAGQSSVDDYLAMLGITQESDGTNAAPSTV